MSAFLVPVVFMPLFISIAILICQQVVRHQMLEELELKHLMTITVSKANLKWIRIGEEIELNGHLFDVNTISLKGNYYTFTGLFDEKETILTQKLSDTRHSPQDNPLRLLVARMMNIVLFKENRLPVNITNARQIRTQFFNRNVDLFISYNPSLVTPPPRV